MGAITAKRMRVGAAILLGVGATLAAAPRPAAAQYSVAKAEAPSEALARHMRALASQPRDFTALIGAGRAALAMGDTQAAAGFFGRAEEVWPASPMPQIGIGAALAHEAEAAAALQYFARAAQLGAASASFALDRGLAYDLLGRHAEAQADYRVALSGADGDEARRRLSLSLAITGNKDEALSILAPLMARGDAGAARVRAFALALTGDSVGARRAIDAAMPGTASQMGYFFQKLPTLRSDQKAAAVHLGVFPDANQSYASAATPQGSTASRGTADRLASIEALLAATADPPVAQAVTPPVSAPPAAQQPVAVAGAATSIAASSNAPRPASLGSARPRVWLQLASGQNAAALPDQFKKIKNRSAELFAGISGYVAEGPDRARLLIGPFRNTDEAEVFAEDLESVRVDAFSWTSPPGLPIRKISTE